MYLICYKIHFIQIATPLQHLGKTEHAHLEASKTQQGGTCED